VGLAAEAAARSSSKALELTGDDEDDERAPLGRGGGAR
jgi:hypothetical protein